MKRRISFNLPATCGSSAYTHHTRSPPVPHHLVSCALCMLNQNFFRFHRLGVFSPSLLLARCLNFFFLLLLGVASPGYSYSFFRFDYGRFLTHPISSLFRCQVFHKIYFVIRFIHLCRRFQHRQHSTSGSM